MLNVSASNLDLESFWLPFGAPSRAPWVSVSSQPLQQLGFYHWIQGREGHFMSPLSDRCGCREDPESRSHLRCILAEVDCWGQARSHMATRPWALRGSRIAGSSRRWFPRLESPSLRVNMQRVCVVRTISRVLYNLLSFYSPGLSELGTKAAPFGLEVIFISKKSLNLHLSWVSGERCCRLLLPLFQSACKFYKALKVMIIRPI